MVRRWMLRLMAGRYGGDQLNVLLMALYVILYIVYLFTRMFIFELLALLLVVLSLFIVLLSVAAGCVLLIGQWTGSYALGAFVMAGSFAIVTAVLFLLRKKLFVDSFVRLFTGIFFEEEEETA